MEEESSMAESYCGTPLNMDPRILFGQQYDLSADIWSLGTIVYEMLMGFAPFTGTDPRNLTQNLRVGDYSVPKAINLSLSCLDFIDKCLKSESTKRIPHDKLLEHPWVAEPLGADSIPLNHSVVG